ncbi:unnamed protein product [Callosobruchus maculatus]|uniref:HEAT repeat-containing protein 6 n=1 Tax=Callosobruchus maculatus TaxID=64391 RepID=A0A653DCZ8_CALMS|nr:unnamed protein product [Callosobruchus maculatus]
MIICGPWIQEAILLVNQCCSFIPTDDGILVQKYSQLLWNLVRHQNLLIEGKTLTLAIQWCLSGLQTRDKNVILDVLQALDTILRSNINKQIIPVGHVVRELCKFLQSRSEKCTLEITLLVLQCLEACTTISDDQKAGSDLHRPLELCSETFLNHLTKKATDSNDLVTNKILQTCLVGLQNVVLQHPGYLLTELGTILGVIKTFMLLGIKNVDYIIPQKLMPSALSIPEIPSLTREKKGGKLTKQKKHRVSGTQKKGKPNACEHDTTSGGYVPATTLLDYNSDSGVGGVNGGNRIKTSDSDFSDSESGKAAKIHHIKTKVRRASLNLLFTVAKNIEKSTMFTYWSSFIPEDSMSGQHNLVTCFLRDPSARNRMTALNVLLLLLTTSKLYLAQAESSDKSTSFTPYSVVLGRMITELHRSLSLTLHEMSIPVLTQALKCYAALVQATPYHRMSSKLMTKVIRNVKPFLYHKDASVQVTALIALGCVLSSEPVLPETTEAMLKSESSKCKQKNDDSLVVDDVDDCASFNDSFEYADFEEPDNAEEDESHGNLGIPWLLKRCLTNLGVEIEETDSSKGAAPVKLESLQILSVMSTKYFEKFILPHLSLIVKALDGALMDSYIDLKLHAGRTVDFIGQAMSKYLSNEDKVIEVPVTQCVHFWKTLLNKSLVDLFQYEENPVLRAVACDCLGSIGPHIFEQLPRDKQILCVTLLFSCTRDGENSVKGAAVRALAICVTYPSLREDTGFVLDTAEAIYRTLKDEHLSVREKASWSLGNLSGALVLSSKESKEAIEEISSEMILKLLKACISGASDNDKVKMNCVRGIGNLLQLVTEEMLKNDPFPDTVEKAFGVLVKCCTTGSNMKVRWNSCYALKNAMQNMHLYKKSYFTNKNWQVPVFNALNELVVSFKNFKVRINAALALSSPKCREHYDNFYYSVWTALLKAMENSGNIEDFNEYKHRDNLVEQICLSLGHLTTFLQVEDLLQLQSTLQLYEDSLKTHMSKVTERLVPEKSTQLSEAVYALNQLEKRKELDENGRQVLERFKIVFQPDI